MNEAAENLEFERAARIRDRIQAIRNIGDKQKVVATRVREQDIIALAQGPRNCCFEVFRFSDGRLYDREDFLMGDVGDAKTARMEFLQQYYEMRQVPPQITMDEEPESADTLVLWLSEKDVYKRQGPIYEHISFSSQRPPISIFYIITLFHIKR